ALPPNIMEATIDEAKKQGIRTAAHLTQAGLPRMNGLDAARLGLTSLEHWLGLAEALYTDRTVQHFPIDYLNTDEQERFRSAGRNLQQAAPRGSERWQNVIRELVDLDITMVPTFAVIE